jgi:nitric oxide reductase large subunit
MSAAAAALIWWIVPAVGLLSALGYAVWVSKFKRKYENDVLRSTDKFSKFQNTFRKSDK